MYLIYGQLFFIKERKYRYEISLIKNDNTDHPIFKCIKGDYNLKDSITEDRETLSCSFQRVLPLENNSKFSIIFSGKGKGETGPLFYINPASTYFGIVKLSE